MSITAKQLADLMPDATQVESDEPEMESTLHYLQLALLVSCLEWLWRDLEEIRYAVRDDFFIGANLTIYYNRQQLKNRDFRGPDFFLVNQTKKYPRRSWVVWEEDGQYPDLIIELLSDSTVNVDRNFKKNLYQDRFRTPEYFWFSPYSLEFAGFRLNNGTYVEIHPNTNGWRWSESLGLYLGIYQSKLRYFTLEGQLISTLEEALEQEIQLAEQERQWAEQESQRAEQESQRAEQESQRAEQEFQRAEQEFQRAEQLAAQLRDLGREPKA